MDLYNTKGKTKMKIKLSKELMDVVKEILEDPEFQYDVGWGDNYKKNLKKVMDVEKNNVLLAIMNGQEENYKDDIKTEKKDGEDVGYLEKVLKEIQKLIKVLSKIKIKESLSLSQKRINEAQQFL